MLYILLFMRTDFCLLLFCYSKVSKRVIFQLNVLYVDTYFLILLCIKYLNAIFKVSVLLRQKYIKKVHFFKYMFFWGVD